jgi:nitroimidazol reductase NimA-like FMN-containing flavoprotein (pyridoxamine 5'-phosphate oxidase superfamily)
MLYHVRRRDKEITDVEVLKKILKTAKYVTLALSKDNNPYLVSLSYGYDEKENCIYFHCASIGKKLDYLRANNIVWGQAILDFGYVDGRCNHLYASVHFQGKVTFIEKPEEKLLALKCIMKHLDQNPERLIAKIDEKMLKETTVGRIDLDYMSGKKSKDLTL